MEDLTTVSSFIRNYINAINFNGAKEQLDKNKVGLIVECTEKNIYSAVKAIVTDINKFKLKGMA